VDSVALNVRVMRELKAELQREADLAGVSLSARVQEVLWEGTFGRRVARQVEDVVPSEVAAVQLVSDKRQRLTPLGWVDV